MALNYWIIWIVCFGVFKQSGKTLAIDDFTCENNVINLHCPEGEVVMMQTAYYNGTAGDENCTNSKTLKPDCGKDVLNIMAKSCDDLNQCQVLANNARFNDSCPSTLKILKVRYECVPWKNTYFVNVTTSTPTCTNCNNPVKQPEVKRQLNEIISNLPPVPASPDQLLDAETAKEVMRSMTPDFVDQFNESTVGLTLGKSVTGVLVKQTDPEDLEEVSLGFNKGTDFNILEDRNVRSQFSRSVTVPKHAFEKALSMNISEPFVAVFRFLNMSKDENNSTVLADEVVAIEMGTIIKNLPDTININFRNMDNKGIPSCHSWNGNGSRPVWTSDGCVTHISGIHNITCRCTHLTFFAVLLMPVNETISTDDVNTLTIIIRVACGLCMFFLGIFLFRHFVMRQSRCQRSTGGGAA